MSSDSSRKRTARDRRYARLEQYRAPSGAASGWLQWKGTDACIDITCVCGANQHLDAEFLYTWRCPACKTLYDLSPHVRMEPVPADDDDDPNEGLREGVG